VATRWWKRFEDMFIRFDRMHERDGYTDRQTPHGGRGRAYAQHRAAKINDRPIVWYESLFCSIA